MTGSFLWDGLIAASPVPFGNANCRLPFRELGFALGLHAVPHLGEHVDVSRVLQPLVLLAAALEDFWLVTLMPSPSPELP